jgi:hypothetical protein
VSTTVETTDEHDQQIRELRAQLRQLEQKQRLTKLRQKHSSQSTNAKRRAKQAAVTQESPPSDFVHGARAIGAELGMSEQQIFHAHRTGVFEDALFKLSPKHLVLSRMKLAATSSLLCFG